MVLAVRMGLSLVLVVCPRVGGRFADFARVGAGLPCPPPDGGGAAAGGGLSLARRKECRKRNRKMSPVRRHFQGDILLVFGSLPGIRRNMPARFDLAMFRAPRRGLSPPRSVPAVPAGSVPAEVCPRCPRRGLSPLSPLGLSPLAPPRSVPAVPVPAVPAEVCPRWFPGSAEVCPRWFRHVYKVRSVYNDGRRGEWSDEFSGITRQAGFEACE